MRTVYCLLLIVIFCGVGCPATTWAQATITVLVKPVFGGEPLHLADKQYITPHGDTALIDAFRFYMTHIGMGASSKTTDKLIDAEDTTTTRITLNVAAGEYDKLSFVVGVDSIDNTNGANSGDLDPAKGMYWAWNTGYIMAKVEGRSAVCKTVHHAFEFHIGGYMPPYNAARQVSLPLPASLHLEKGSSATITLTADVAAWFAGDLNLSTLNSILIPGKPAAAMADKYATMFKIVSATIVEAK
jgi:hypothetical protein